jgi:hypothetical protein
MERTYVRILYQFYEGCQYVKFSNMGIRAERCAEPRKISAKCELVHGKYECCAETIEIVANLKK